MFETFKVIAVFAHGLISLDVAEMGSGWVTAAITNVRRLSQVPSDSETQKLVVALIEEV